MKTFAFKILSTLLAVVLLVTALPLAAFADDVSPCASLTCEHLNTRTTYEYFYEYVSNEEHKVYLYRFVVCLSCQDDIFSDWLDIWDEPHTIDPTVDQECEMEGPCIHCGETIYW